MVYYESAKTSGLPVLAAFAPQLPCPVVASVFLCTAMLFANTVADPAAAPSPQIVVSPILTVDSLLVNTSGDPSL